MIDKNIIDAFNKCAGLCRKEGEESKDEWLRLFYYYNEHVPENRWLIGDCEFCCRMVLTFIRLKIKACVTNA